MGAEQSTLIETDMPLSLVMPGTRYFEVESTAVGTRFAVWITTPPRYDLETEVRYPAVYQVDGNLLAPLTAPLQALLRDDPINPIVPFVQVSVGYTGEEARRHLAVRARDLLPPNEVLPGQVDESTMNALVQAGFLDETGAALYLRNLRNPAADNFLEFLARELHPLVLAAYRIDEASTGLFGVSYGGLFATYVALQRSPFQRIGAASPGILSRVSRIFELYEAELAAGADHSGRMLHVTVGERELTVPSSYQPLVGAGTAEFIVLAGQRPLKGLAFSSRVLPEESHASGAPAAWFSYLRACYSAAERSALLV
jgi:predicted alpha/beta superfamily hydrolase